MELESVIKQKPSSDKVPDIAGSILFDEEQKRITDFFSILIKIDKRLKGQEAKQ